MRTANTIAWIIAVLAVGAVWARWSQIKWYLANRTMVDQAVDAAEGLKQAGVLK